MAERGTKRGIIRSVSLWPLLLTPTNGRLECYAGKKPSVGGKKATTQGDKIGKQKAFYRRETRLDSWKYWF